MIDKKVEGCTDAEVRQTGLAMSSQKDAWSFARVARPKACIVEIGNTKKPGIDLGREAYKGRVIAFKLDYNICREQLG